MIRMLAKRVIRALTCDRPETDLQLTYLSNPTRKNLQTARNRRKTRKTWVDTLLSSRNSFSN